MELISIGKILGAQGNKGEVKALPLTDFPQRFEKLKEVYLGKGQKVQIEGFRYHKGKIILKFSGYDSLEEALQLKGKVMMVEEKDAVKLPQGSYFIHDIIGLDVFTPEGKYLGKIREVFSTLSNDVYVIEKEAEEILIPATKELVKEIDLQNRRMSINLMKGLI
jgi:16S rRNA processing protein RimM